MNRALIVRLGSLGDVVHAIPVAASLRAAFPQALIDWATHPAYVPLVGLVRGVDHVVAVDTRAWRPSTRGNVPRAVTALRRAAYDVVIDLQGLLKSAVLARAVGGRRTIGFSRADLREPMARVFYGEVVPPVGAVHVVEKNLAVCRLVGAGDGPARFPLTVPPSTAARSVSEDAGPTGFALLNPGAAWPNKRWPAERFGAAAVQLRRTHGLMPVVLWGPGERPLADAVVAASAGTAVLAPATSLLDLVALIGAARLLVSGDTGPLHLAAALGTPIVGLFGPTQFQRNGPWAAADVSLSRAEACECLYQRRCRRAVPCIQDIRLDEVQQAVTRRIGVRN